MKIDLKEISLQIVPILKNEGVTKPAVFGSFAEGTAKEGSDLDLLIEFPQGKTLFDLIDLKQKLEKKLNRKVDIITYGSIPPLLRDIILPKRIPLYE